MAHYFARNKAKLAGLAVGILGSIVLMVFLAVAYSGDPIGGPSQPPEQVYFF